MFASSIIVLRVWVDFFFFASCLLFTGYAPRVEIWERKKIVLGISVTTWLINLGAFIRCALPGFLLLEIQSLNQVQVWP